MPSDASAEPLIFVGSCDLAGIVRGKGFPAAELPTRLSGEAKPLPRSLGEALANLDVSTAAGEWFGDLFFDVYRRFKRSELGVVEGLDPAEICARYAEVY